MISTWFTFVLIFVRLAFAAEPNYLPTFTSSKKFFQQSNPLIPEFAVSSANFGLNSQYTWNDVVSSLNSNQKLFFLQRHGEGWHNVAQQDLHIGLIEWQCYWSLQDGKDGIEWYDAELTPKGHQEIKNLVNQIKNTTSFPHPDKFYVSPLRRTLETWQETWLNLPHKTATIKEFAREWYGIDTESKRHDRAYIESSFPGFDFEDGFQSDDVLWSPVYREGLENIYYRGAAFLADIFEDAKDEKVISVVSHGGLINAILAVAQHRLYNLQTGGLIPVVIEIQNNYKTYPLDHAYTDFFLWCPLSQPNITTSVDGGSTVETTVSASYSVPTSSSAEPATAYKSS
ncbi:hypothetical protein CANMA_005384 [Candida margitis]|uniref:uncharacterized protein n=1 Tax=Candida margitis TaxID=1775924 RepID=UPI002226A5BF|nr:uncharacterized protein CANMA_005384 [Candida margitis]KAI5950194.1 hypothetical protein CANMA_005384 [Candida margitis]